MLRVGPVSYTHLYVRPKYDGTHQEFPDLDLKGLGIDNLYDSQKDAIWMDKLLGGGIIILLQR